jgi:hypothetical protein
MRIGRISRIALLFPQMPYPLRVTAFVSMPNGELVRPEEITVLPSFSAFLFIVSRRSKLVDPF